MLPIAVTGQIVDVSSTESNKKTLSSWCCAFLGHKLLTVWIGQVLFTIDTCTFIECWVAPFLSDFNFLCQKNLFENQFLIKCLKHSPNLLSYRNAKFWTLTYSIRWSIHICAYMHCEFWIQSNFQLRLYECLW